MATLDPDMPISHKENHPLAGGQMSPAPQYVARTMVGRRLGSLKPKLNGSVINQQKFGTLQQDPFHMFRSLIPPLAPSRASRAKMHLPGRKWASGGSDLAD
jgi:hypothetical protein